ncbi:MFS transporter [Streptomyces fuscigenes]|uniref:MFS transporter n=1 Tax=Streptomyces fuscigenes TaxID=1528880 RepID=UPI001F2C47D7|nr:MFS transporter [Streptomyces fuscigenes]MCF3964029.1 MFS transporter [Streptomyces fuscigenes]
MYEDGTWHLVPHLFRRALAILPDLTPLRALRDFRLLWLQGLVTSFGSSMTMVALPLQIKELTDSPFAVGAMGAVELVPLIVFGLYGGALADAVDRRRVILLSEAGLGVLALVLLADSLLPHPALWPLYVVAAAVSALSGLQQPALGSLIARIVPHDQLTSASALNFMRGQLAAVVGPSLAGVVVAYAGLPFAYSVTVVGFLLTVPMCLRLAPAPPSGAASRPSLGSVVEGARYAWSKPVLLGTYAMDVAAMFFAYPVTLFPFLADDLHATWALGLMYSAVPFGSMLVTATSGWASRTRRHGRMVALGAGSWGLAMAATGLMSHVWLVLLCLAAAGAGDMLSGLARHTIWDQTVPDELRGRLAGIEVLSYSCGPQLGQVRAGTTAGLTGTRPAIWGGGFACVAAVGLLALALPKLLSYNADTDPDALRRRAQKEAVARGLPEGTAAPETAGA